MVTSVLPESIIGIIGGGQLGKMLSNAAQALGYKVVIWSEEEDCPACRVATETIIGKYTDNTCLRKFIDKVDVVTVETEHIPLVTLEAVEKEKLLYPSAHIISIAQNRKKEKEWLSNHEIPVVPFRFIHSVEDINQLQKDFGEGFVLKTITGGYDGKGQLRIKQTSLSLEEENRVEDWLQSSKVLVAEKWLPIKAELSVIAARNHDNSFAAYQPVENEHRNHILHRTIAPARLSEDLMQEAVQVTKEIMDKMDYKGLLCVEFFYGMDGKLYVNELAPRPHNSGHYTLDAATTSQFEQTIRSICNLPLGDTKLLSPSVMINLLGDLWKKEFNIMEILNQPATKLHLYGKKEARAQRKMGHYTTVAETLEKAIEISEKLYLSL